MDSLSNGHLYQNVLNSLEEAGRVINCDPNCFERLKRPRRAIAVSIPVRMDDYSIKVFEGFRVQYNSTLGPFKGGIRYHQGVNMSEVAGLAALMTFKNSLLNLPLGGAKGGVTVDPTKLSITEKQNLTRRFTSELGPFIGPERDIPAPDVGTDAQTMAWIMDTFSHERGFATPGVVTGKPIEIGGSLGRTGATGLGVIYVAENAASKLGKNLSECRLAIQGFGNVGQHAALYGHELGAKIVAVSDVSGGIFCGDGLDIPKLMEYVKQNGFVSGFEGSEKISNEELLQLEVDGLLPCALDNVINESNMEKIKAKMIIEGANGPTSVAATKYLTEKGCLIAPDVVANGGGVIVSYFEWVQDITLLFWDESEINSRLKTIINRAFDNVWTFSKEHGYDMRLSAMAVSVKRLERAMLLRGLYPR